MSRDTSQAFVIGYQAGYADATLDARIEAFAAIRRAAECARKADAWDVYHGHLIRQCIRAAITSSSKRTPQTHRNAHRTTGARDE